MFGKSKSRPVALEPHEMVAKIEAEKLRQMGPIPHTIPAPPVLKFLVVLRHGMPAVTVKASRHTFGQVDGSMSLRRKSCEGRTTERYTHFIVDGETTFIEQVNFDFQDGPRYRWAPQVESDLVFSIRTDDILMVAEEGHCDGQGASASCDVPVQVLP